MSEPVIVVLPIDEGTDHHNVGHRFIASFEEPPETHYGVCAFGRTEDEARSRLLDTLK